MKKYAVIGGQYASFYYGSANTLEGAKRLASKNIELWDNWQGWHYPDIYLSADCCEVRNFYGEQIAANDDAIPVATRWYGDKWYVREV